MKDHVIRLAEALRVEVNDTMTAVYPFGSAGYNAYEPGIAT
jgi:hypothetical protein